MLQEELQRAIVKNIVRLTKESYRVVVVHGGGPFIRRALDRAGVESEFVDGHRKTTPEALHHIETALKGEVNGTLVRLFNQAGARPVGLSGKDGGMVIVERRFHVVEEGGEKEKKDIGHVGDVVSVDTELLHRLLDGGYLPVVACLAADEDGRDYNVNADMFAGHLAGALQADRYLVLTDVDGLLRDLGDPDSLISRLSLQDLPALAGTVVKGGMIPKVESCEVALRGGAKLAGIINGTKPEQLLSAVSGEERTGTVIYAQKPKSA